MKILYFISEILLLALPIAGGMLIGGHWGERYYLYWGISFFVATIAVIFLQSFIEKKL